MKKLLFILLFFIAFTRCYQDWKGDWYCNDTDTGNNWRCYQDWKGDWYCN